jgi:predicted ATPase/DNA-binding SARP family transcriptional activator
MQYRLLGPLEVERDGEPLALGGRQQRAVLAILALSANRVVTRDRLVDELWGDEPPETAVATLQVYVSRLRKVLPSDALQTRPPGYALAVDPDEVDIFRFEHLVADSQTADPQQAARLLREGLALWRGQALAEFEEPLLRLESRRLEESRLAALEARVDADLACGRETELVGELATLIGLYPRRERLHRQLVLALYRAGRQAEALDAYREARTVLDELGLEPGEELRELERMILIHDPELAVPAPVRVALPDWPTPFVGRSAEVEAVRTLLEGGHRLVTLSGPGGVGKTRLAAAAAERTQEGFADGAFFVQLTEVRDPASVRPAVAAVLDVRAGESLDAFLRGRELLLVLDNFEQLVDGGGVLVAGLLRDAPRLSLLVTSREPLRVSGEHVHAVPPLGEEEAIDLFVTRARDADDAFRLSDENRPAVEDVCERLDGLPLALELAAARVRTLDPSDMLSRLDRRLAFLAKGPRDAPARQQTIRATIEWSFVLLDEPQQQLFARLACFVGGFTFQAAEAVCAATLENLEALVDKSLVQHEGPRFRMLETVREFAGEALEQGEPAGETRARHARYFADLHEQAYSERFARAEWSDHLQADFDNVDAALDNLFEYDRLAYLQLAGTRGGDWERLSTALASTSAPPATRARALMMASIMGRLRGEHETAIQMSEEAVALFRGLGATADECIALNSLCYAYGSGGHDAQMRAAAEEALRVAELTGNALLLSRARQGLCQLFVAEEDAERAEPLARQLFDAAPSSATKRGAMHYLADCALIREDYDLAVERYLAAADANWLAGMRRQVQTELLGVAMAASGRGDAQTALQLFGAGDRYVDDFGTHWGPASFWRRWIDRYRAIARAALGVEAEQAVQEGRGLTQTAALSLAHSLVAAGSQPEYWAKAMR